MHFTAGPPKDLANPGPLPDADKASQFPDSVLAAGNVLSLLWSLGPALMPRFPWSPS